MPMLRLQAAAVTLLVRASTVTTAQALSTMALPPVCAYVRASSTSPVIRDVDHYPGQSQGHYVCDPAEGQPSRGLFLFMPGTSPNTYTQIVETAASVGYHAVGIQWDDAPCVTCVCAKRCDGFNRTQKIVDCSRDAEKMRMFGDHMAPPNSVGYTVDAHNAVQGRLQALLYYLQNRTNTSSPLSGSGWQGYMDANGALRWPRLTVGGHSRASDYPVMLSKDFPIKRGLIFGGPGQEFLGVCDGIHPPSDKNCNPSEGFAEATWLAEPSRVAAGQLYGLVAGYPGDCCNMGKPAWPVLNMSGAGVFDSATAALPSAALAGVLQGARQLFDTQLCLHAKSPHMCMISNMYAPFDERGRSKLIPIWHYMLTNEAPPAAAAVALESQVNCTMSRGRRLPAAGPPIEPEATMGVSIDPIGLEGSHIPLKHDDMSSSRPGTTVPSNGLAAGGSSSKSGSYVEYKGKNCCRGAGGVNIDSGYPRWVGLTVTQCKAHCDADSACHCIVMSSSGGRCWRRAACNAEQCGNSSQFNAWIKSGGPPVPPNPPRPPLGPPGQRPYPDTWTPRGPPCKGCPNIILSITDDQDLVLGGWVPMQKTAARIAARGITMSQWRIHTPICSPSRSELISGRYYHNIKSSLAVPTEALAPTRIIYAGTAHVNGSLYKNQSFGVHLRREKGYQIALFGKANFNTYDGFDRWFQGASLSYGSSWQDDESPTGMTRLAADEYPTAVLGNKSIEWLRRENVSGAAAEGRPFFLYFASHCPHFPATPAHWYDDACPGASAVRTANYNHTNGDYHELIAKQPPLTEVDALLVDQLARSRCQCLLSVDDANAAILETVQELGVENSTYVFVTRRTHTSYSACSDGAWYPCRPDTQPSRHKRTASSVHIVRTSHGDQVDLAPTWLELAGIQPPSYMDGRSILPFLVPETAIASPHSSSLRLATAGILQQRRSNDVPPVLMATEHSADAAAAAAAVVTADPHAWRNESFFQYYDAGPWAPANGGDDCHICNAGKGTVRKFDDFSNTYIGLYVHDPSLGEFKYAEFQTNCSSTQVDRSLGTPSCFDAITSIELFNLTQDPYELQNIASEAKPELLADLKRRLRTYYPCQGSDCP